jgi:uncharacterized protein
MNQSDQGRSWANPTPAGLVALAVACFVFFAMLTGNVTSAAMPLMGLWLLGGFAIQIVVAIIDLKGGNTAGGNTFLFFSAFFMFVSGMEMIAKYLMLQSNIKFDGHIDGWAWLCLTIVVYLWTPAFFKSPLMLTLVVLALDVALPFLALMDLGLIPKSLSSIPAWALMAAGLCAIYLSAGMVVNTTFGKKVYPLPGPPIK